MAHPTKTKADLGLAMVISDLAKKGISVCLPISEHLPYDLIATNDEGGVSRVQAKYSRLHNGTIVVKLTSGWANRRGCHDRTNPHGMFEAYAVYCPETEKVYYIPTQLIRERAMKRMFKLRLEQPPSPQRCNLTSQFEDVSIIFGKIIMEASPNGMAADC